MAAAVVDILFTSQDQVYFAGDGNQIKEFAVVDITSKASQQWRFCDPCMENAMNILASHPLTKSEMMNGDVKYEQLDNILRNATHTYKVLFVFGDKEYKAIQKLLPHRSNIFNLQSIEEIKEEDTKKIDGTECMHHFHEGKTNICPLVRAYALADWCCDNWPLVNMMETKARLKTFKTWPINEVCKKELASAGFVYQPTKDKKNLTQCIYCGLQVTDWKKDDVAIIKHIMRNKYCVLFNFCNYGLA
jgi:hypothetical protein